MNILIIILICLFIGLLVLLSSSTSIPIEQPPEHVYSKSVITCKTPISTFSSLSQYYSYFIQLLKGELQTSLTNETTQTIYRSMNGLAFFSRMDNPLIQSILSGVIEEKVVSNSYSLMDKLYASVVHNRITLIQGPPGTGKTYTSAKLISNYIAEYPNKRILVCSPSNEPLVSLKEEVIKNGVNVNTSIYYSYTYSNNNKTYTDNDPYNLINQMKEIKKKTLYSEREILYMLLKQCNLLFTTCTSIIDPMFEYERFDLILIDEASRCIEPEAILPLLRSHSSTNCVLVGDDKQLGPVILSKNVKDCLSISLFKRLIELRTLPTYTLNVQYRMHPDISKYSYPYFYTTPIQNYDEDCVTKECKDWYTSHPQFVSTVLAKYSKARPISSRVVQPEYITAAWIDNRTPEKIINNRTYVNEGEAQIVCNIVNECIRSGVNESQITVLVPYKKQMELFGCIPNVKVKTIDSYQGSDNDIVILSLVRSNDKGDIGFLEEKERINVALTRAKRVLFIVGNRECFETTPATNVWKQIISLF